MDSPVKLLAFKLPNNKRNDPIRQENNLQMSASRPVLFMLCILSMACGDRSAENNKGQKKATAQTQVKTNNTEPAQEENALGASVYKSTCVICHGADGKLSLKGSKPLFTSKMNLEERIQIITKGKGSMLPHRFLGEEKIKAVALYIDKFKE